jgi:hypothetical protein
MIKMLSAVWLTQTEGNGRKLRIDSFSVGCYLKQPIDVAGEKLS